MRRLFIATLSLLAIIMLTLAAQTHGQSMALAGVTMMASHSQTGHDSTASGNHAKTHMAQCSTSHACQSSGVELCDFVCTGMSHFILPALDAPGLFGPSSRVVAMGANMQLPGIKPSLDDPPPISLIA